MKMHRLLKPGNYRVRLLVGLLLAGLVCIQVTRTEAFRTGDSVQAISGDIVGETAPEALSKLDELAKTNHIALLEQCLANYRENFQSYTATLIKQERINGVLGPEQTVEAKFMQSPFSVVLKWTENPSQADRIIYVDGKYGNKMLVRPSNAFIRKLVPSVLRDPRCKDARAASLRTVDDFGFENSIQSMLAVYRKARQAGDLQQEFGGQAKVFGREALVLVRHLPPKGDYPTAETRIYIDRETLVPICVEGFGWNEPAELICRYVYKDVRFNVQMSEENFLPENNDIKFNR